MLHSILKVTAFGSLCLCSLSAKGELAFRLNESEIPGIVSIYNDVVPQDNVCSGVLVEQATVLVNASCVSTAAVSGGGGAYTPQLDRGFRSSAKAIDHYFIDGVSGLSKTSIQTAPGRAPLDIAVLVFEKEVFKNRNAFLKLSESAPSNIEAENQVYFVGLSKSDGSGNRSLASRATTIEAIHDGYFLARVPESVKTDAGLAFEQLAQVDWQLTGALVLNSNREVLGIVSSIQDNVIVKGSTHPGKYAFITNLRGAKMQSLYAQAINCPEHRGRHCATRFPNSGVKERGLILENAIYANRESSRCDILITKHLGNNGKLEKVSLKGSAAEGGSKTCENYNTVFGDCTGDVCVSDLTCETLTFDPGGIILKTRGKEYTFGKKEHVTNPAPIDGTAPFFETSKRKACFAKAADVDATPYCMADGSKWIWSEEPKTWNEAKTICERNGYKFSDVETSLAFAKESNAQFDFWVNKRGAQTSVLPQRGLITRSGQSHSFELIDVVPGTKRAYACYCNF